MITTDTMLIVNSIVDLLCAFGVFLFGVGITLIGIGFHDLAIAKAMPIKLNTAKQISKIINTFIKKLGDAKLKIKRDSEQ